MSRPPLFAVEHIRKMRGGSQAHLLRASDGNLYVTKFQNNPGGIRTLASEFLATELGLFLGLPVAVPQVIEVADSLIASTPALKIEIDGITSPCVPGLQLGSRYAGDPQKDRIFDHMPESQFHRVVNRTDIAQILAFDKWVGNCDRRQAVFVKQANRSRYRMIFIDQHYCLGGHWWSFPDLPLHGTYHDIHIYKNVTGWESFEPTLTRIKAIDYADLWRSAAQIPHEWIEHDGEGLFSVVETLHSRGGIVCDFITTFRNSSCNPFPSWRDCAFSSPQCLTAALDR